MAIMCKYIYKYKTVNMNLITDEGENASQGIACSHKACNTCTKFQKFLILISG